MQKRYCLDTGVLINAWQKHYPPRIARKFWTFLGRMINDGTAIVPREVYEEIEKKEDEIFQWVKDRSEFIREPTDDVIVALKAIMQHDDYCRLVKMKGSGRSGADPWVIAHAQVLGATVVTEEGTGGKDPKIPDVCRLMGIPCIRTVAMLENEDFSF